MARARAHSKRPNWWARNEISIAVYAFVHSSPVPKEIKNDETGLFTYFVVSWIPEQTRVHAYRCNGQYCAVLLYNSTEYTAAEGPILHMDDNHIFFLHSNRQWFLRAPNVVCVYAQYLDLCDVCVANHFRAYAYIKVDLLHFTCLRFWAEILYNQEHVVFIRANSFNRAHSALDVQNCKCNKVLYLCRFNKHLGWKRKDWYSCYFWTCSWEILYYWNGIPFIQASATSSRQPLTKVFLNVIKNF